MIPFRVLLAEDHALFREGVKSVLRKGHGLEFAGEVSDGLELMEFLKTSVPDLVILDISMPNFDGLAALKEIKNRYPTVKVLILTMHKSREYLLQSYSAGADGYLLKGDASPDLLVAVDRIRQGGNFISSQMLNQVVDIFRGNMKVQVSKGELSQRERAVLGLLAQGKTNKQIAKNLSISIPTVQCHRHNMKKKLNIKTTAGLIRYALQKGFTLQEVT